MEKGEIVVSMHYVKEVSTFNKKSNGKKTINYIIWLKNNILTLTQKRLILHILIHTGLDEGPDKGSYVCVNSILWLQLAMLSFVYWSMYLELKVKDKQPKNLKVYS